MSMLVFVNWLSSSWGVVASFCVFTLFCHWVTLYRLCILFILKYNCFYLLKKGKKKTVCYLGPFPIRLIFMVPHKLVYLSLFNTDKK